MEGNRGVGGQYQLTAQLHIVIAGQGIAHDVARVADILLLLDLGGHGNRPGGQTVGRSCDGEGTRHLGRLHHRHQLAGGRITAQALIRGNVLLATVVHTDDLARALDGQGDVHVVGVDDVAVGVLDPDGDVAQVVAVGGDGGPVGLQFQPGSTTGGLDHATTIGVGNGGLTVSLEGFDLQGAFPVVHHESGVQLLVGGAAYLEGPRTGVPAAVGVVSTWCVRHSGGSGAYFCPVQVQLDHGGVGVDHHFHLPIPINEHVIPVPGGQQMQSVHLIVPLALIEPVGILGDTVGVHNTEVRGLGGGPSIIIHVPGARAVPGSGLADVVKAGPDELAHGGILRQSVIPGLAGHGAPAHSALVIRGEQPVSLAAVGVVVLPVIHAPAVDGGSSLCVIGQVATILPSLEPVVARAVVDTDDTAKLLDDGGHTGDAPICSTIVVPDGGRAAGIHFFQPGAQVPGDAGILADPAFIGPLEDLVAQTVHNYRRGVPVLIHHSLQVELGPSHAVSPSHDGVTLTHGPLKPGGVILTVSVLGHDPAIEGLVHDHHALFVCNLDQLGSSGVMGDPDGVDPHLLEDLHLSLNGPVPCFGSQRALIVVHTHALELHLFPVEGKAEGGAELRPAEAKLGGIAVHNLPIHQHLGEQGVQVGRVGGPEFGICHLQAHDYLALAAGGHCSGRWALGAGHHHFATLLIDGLAQTNGSGRSAVVLHRGLHLHGTVRALAVGQLRGGDKGPVAGYVDLVGNGQVDATVNAAAGVPAAGGGLVLYLDGQHVVLAVPKQVAR